MNFLTSEIVKGTDWRAVERAVARIMSHCGWSDVRIVGASGDGGGDVIAVRSESGRQLVYVVQVKAVTGATYVGPTAIQQALNALAIYEGDVAVVATNGDFTETARNRRDALGKMGFDVRLWNGKFLEELLARWTLEHSAKRDLRNYQEDIVNCCLEKFSSGGNRVQFVVATGLGKTVIAAEILSRLYKQGLKRALILCHAQELALQLEQSFWPQLDKSIPTRVFFDGSLPKPYEGVNFGLYQTFSNYLNGIDPTDYDIVIVDEAHHALAHGFRGSIRYLHPKLLIGMTATPWRGDGANIDSIFGSPVAQVSLVDGMKMGYLAQVDYRIYVDSINWENVHKETKGQATIRDLNKRLFVPQRDEMIVQEIVATCRQVSAPHVIVFCASIEHCRRFADMVTGSSQFICKPLSGVDKIDRNRTLMEFAAGKIHAVTAVDVLNEGIDVPDVNILVFLRSTHSRRLFVQQLGRGLRLAPGKDRVRVLDFVSDIRRLAEVLEMDAEARRPPKDKFQSLYFKDGIVTFINDGSSPFAQQWLQDVADLGDADETRLLRFPFPL